MSSVLPVAVSFVIPVKTNSARLRDCLDSLFGQVSSVKYEVIVVDDGSEDDSLAVARSRAATVLHGAGGPYSCRNIGIREASGRIVVLLDSNMRLESTSWIEDALEQFDSLGIDVATPQFKFEFSKRPYEVFECANAISYLDAAQIGFNGIVGGCAMIRRSAFELVGLFREVRSNGDTMWGALARARGLKLGVLDRVACVYPAKGRKAMLRTELRIGLGNRAAWYGGGGQRFFWGLRILRGLVPPSLSEVRIRMARRLPREGQPSLWRVFWALIVMRLYRAAGRLGHSSFLGIRAD